MLSETDLGFLVMQLYMNRNKSVGHMKYKSIEDLQSLIDNEIEESTELEYKSSFAIENKKWKEELAKDVSAMANANGGTIVYGIRQKEGGIGHAIASDLLPIPFTEMSKDKLSQLLSSNIQPVIDNVEITVIPKDKDSGFFIVDVPQSNTAHQNRLTHLYYKRRNATIEMMEDYEIRDVMNRSKHPVIELEFELHKTIINITEKPCRKPLLNEQLEDKHYTEAKFELKFRLVNVGTVYAKYINYFIHIPLEIIPEKEKHPDSIDRENNCYEFFGDNTVRDLTSFKGYSGEYGPARYDPLLPGIRGGWETIELSFDGSLDDIFLLPPISYSLMADNAPEQKKVVEWKGIKLVEKRKSITKDPYNIRFNPILYK